MRKLIFAFACGLALIARANAASPEAPLPLDAFLKDYVFDEIKISPDGSKVAALSSYKGHLNLYVIDLKTKKPAMLTGMTTMDVRGVMWVGNDRLLFSGKEDGYGTGGLFAIDADGKNSTVLSKSVAQDANSGAHISRQSEFLSFYGKSTTEILVVNNERRAEDPDVYRLNVRTGSKKLVAWNPGRVVGWVADHNGAVRVGFAQQKMEVSLYYRDGADGDFRKIKSWSFKHGEIEPLAFDEANRLLYVKSNLGTNTAAIQLMDPTTGEIVKDLYQNETYDSDHVILDRNTGRLLGFYTEAEKPLYTWVDENVKNIQSLIDRELPGSVNEMYSRSLDGTWIVFLSRTDRDPGTFFLFNSKELTLEKLVSKAPWLDPKLLSERRSIEYTARDGLKLHGYLTLPHGLEPKNLPLIVNPHGGPWARDEFGYRDEIQFLASRGYAILQMDFRASTGYGRKLLEAGYNQWGLAMQDDITDGVRWAIAQGYADPKRIGIYGASYGGYATMAGLAFTPELYRCGINYVGVTDIALLLKTIPDSWERMREDLENKTGNTKEDRDRLEATSPLRNADKVQVPVFFIYGELDERVDIKHGTRMANAIKRKGIPVEWMSRVDEGHGYRRPENKKDLYTQMEKFLAKYMGPVSEYQGEVIVGPSKVVEEDVKLK